MTAKSKTAADSVPEGTPVVGTVLQNKDFVPTVPEVGTWRDVSADAAANRTRSTKTTKPASKQATEKEN